MTVMMASSFRTFSILGTRSIRDSRYLVPFIVAKKCASDVRCYLSTEKVHSHHPTALVPVANGTEEMEAVIIVDTLIRAGVDVVIATVHDIKQIKCSRGVEILAASYIRDCVEREWDCVVLPGGMPGATNLYESPSLQRILKDQHQAKKLIGAICASPAVVLAPLGILDEKKAVCYPVENFTSKLPHHVDDESVPVFEDGHVITSKGPGTALAFALKIAEKLMGDEVVAIVKKQMLA